MSKFIETTVRKEISQKEVNIVQRLANEERVHEIAANMDLNLRTLESKILSMRKSFGCVSIVGLVVLFMRNKLIK